jgi:hypothetical protein
MRYTTRSIGHRVGISVGDLPYVGRGVGEVEIRLPRHDDRNRPDAAAADRVRRDRRVIRAGYRCRSVSTASSRHAGDP